jgi:hypothetical protein
MGRIDLFSDAGWPFQSRIRPALPPGDQQRSVAAYIRGRRAKRNKPRKRLPDACCAYGIEGWEQLDKETMAQISAMDTGRSTVATCLEYCEDVRKTVELQAQVRGRHLTGRQRQACPALV